MDHVLFQSDRFAVRRMSLTLPDGKTIAKDVIDHPPAVAILPLLDAGRVVLIHNYRYTIGAELLEIPAGKIEAGESPEQAAARECREETGYHPRRLGPLCRFYPSPGVLGEEMVLFWATDLQPGRQELAGGERIRVEVMPLDRLREMVARGEIRDAKTLVALLYYERYGRPGVLV